METATYSEPSIPLPPFALDPNEDRELLLELADPDSNQGWSIYGLIDGSYVFEMQAENIVLTSERHVSFADASARVDRWYGNRTIRKAA